MCPSASSPRLLNPSSNGGFTTAPGSLFQALLSGEMFCLIFNLNLPWSTLRPFPPVLFLGRRDRGHHGLKMAAVAQFCIICYQSGHGQTSLPSELPRTSIRSHQSWGFHAFTRGTRLIQRKPPQSIPWGDPTGTSSSSQIWAHAIRKEQRHQVLNSTSAEVCLG